MWRLLPFVMVMTLVGCGASQFPAMETYETQCAEAFCPPENTDPDVTRTGKLYWLFALLVVPFLGAV